MPLFRLGARRTFTPTRPVLALRHSIRSLVTESLPAKSTNPTPNLAAKKFSYPQRLLIYHAGTGRTVFIGCMKVTTIIIFSFFSLVVAPTHFYADEPTWVSGAVILSGIIPMLSVAYMSGPFVNYIHLRLPPFARHSREMLMRYSKNLPKDAELDITTMNYIGLPRVSRVKVSELFPVRQRFGLANFARDTKTIHSKRPWWMGEAFKQFGVHGGTGSVKEVGVWENVEQCIRRMS